MGQSRGRHAEYREHDRIQIRRFWILSLGRTNCLSFSYSFISLKLCPLPSGCALASLLEPVPSLRPRLWLPAPPASQGLICISTSEISSDNFFYFYRWHKRILLQSVIMAVENLVLRCARSINMVSIGFKDALWDGIVFSLNIQFSY